MELKRFYLDKNYNVVDTRLFKVSEVDVFHMTGDLERADRYEQWGWAIQTNFDSNGKCTGGYDLALSDVVMMSDDSLSKRIISSTDELYNNVNFLQVVDDPNIKYPSTTISDLEKGWCSLSSDGELKCGDDFKQIKIKTPNYQHALNKLMTIPLQVKDNHYTTIGSREEAKILQKALDELHQLKCKYGQVKKELDERKASDRNAFKDGYEQAEFDMQAVKQGGK